MQGNRTSRACVTSSNHIVLGAPYKCLLDTMSRRWMVGWMVMNSWVHFLILIPEFYLIQQTHCKFRERNMKEMCKLLWIYQLSASQTFFTQVFFAAKRSSKTKFLWHLWFRLLYSSYKYSGLDFPSGPVVKNPPANAGDTGLIPAVGRLHMPQGN